jgi:hypothetical protein
MLDHILTLISLASGLGTTTALALAMRHHWHIIAHTEPRSKPPRSS